MTTLTELRQEIDNIDEQILVLLSNRMKCSQQIAHIKKTSGTAILDQNREITIKGRLKEISKRLSLNEDFVLFLYSQIIDQSKFVQANIIEEGQEARNNIQGI